MLKTLRTLVKIKNLNNINTIINNNISFVKQKTYWKKIIEDYNIILNIDGNIYAFICILNSKNNNTISKIKNDLKLKKYYNYIKILKLYILKNI